MTPRQIAKLSSERFYSTGKTCVHGHLAQRYTSSGECVICESERRERNCEVRKNRAADWYAQNQPAKLAASAAWRDANRERQREACRVWAAKNRHACRALDSRRRARKLSATTSWDAELTDLVEIEAFDLAARRELATGFAWDVDHMIPLQARQACGLHVWSNLQVIPASLNGEKFNKMMLTEPGEWLRAI